MSERPAPNVSRAQAIAKAIFAEECDALNVRSVEYRVLRAIEANPGLKEAALAASIASERSTTCDVLKQLESKGWLERGILADEKTPYPLRLSSQGRVLLDQVNRAVQRARARLLTPLSPHECEEISGILSELAKVPKNDTVNMAGFKSTDMDEADEEKKTPGPRDGSFSLDRKFLSQWHVMQRDRIVEFAREFDPQPQHLSDASAADSSFGALVASGWHTASVSMRLFLEALPQVGGGLQGVALEDLAWPKPVRPGDRLRVEAEIIAKRESRSRPETELVKIRAITTNQDGQVVQTATHTVMMRKDTGEIPRIAD